MHHGIGHVVGYPAGFQLGKVRQGTPVNDI